MGERALEPVRDQIIHHSLHGVFAIRQGPWKLIMKRGTGGFTKPKSVKAEDGEPTGQLYNLEDDPAETTNVWPVHPEIVSTLTEALERTRRAKDK